MKPLSEVVSSLLVIQIQIQAVWEPFSAPDPPDPSDSDPPDPSDSDPDPSDPDPPDPVFVLWTDANVVISAGFSKNLVQKSLVSQGCGGLER